MALDQDVVILAFCKSSRVKVNFFKVPNDIFLLVERAVRSELYHMQFLRTVLIIKPIVSYNST